MTKPIKNEISIILVENNSLALSIDISSELIIQIACQMRKDSEFERRVKAAYEALKIAVEGYKDIEMIPRANLN